MRTPLTIALALATACIVPTSSFAQPSSGRLPGLPNGLAFQGVPKGWTMGGNSELQVRTFTGGVPNGERAAILTPTRRMAEAQFGTLMQTISAEAFVDRRVRLSALVTVDEAAAACRVALWMRVSDASGRVAAMDDMEARPIQAGTVWNRQEVVLDVPNEAASIMFGILMAGSDGERACAGSVKVSGFRLEIVGGDVPTTAVPRESLPLAPVNLDFSQL